MGILDFFSDEAGQRRRAALDEFGRDVGYYVPPNLRGLLGSAAEMTPSATLDRASQKSSSMLAPNRTPMQRVGDFGGMLSETAGVVAPVVVAGRAGMPAAQALQEALLGFSAPPSAAEAMARTVLDLRAAGRANEVTEEMMAAADDTYMYFNTPLPMDVASRNARADELFPKPGFHGSNFDIDGFRGHVYSSDNPTLASTYIRPRGGDGQVYPLRLGSTNGDEVIEGQGRYWDDFKDDFVRAEAPSIFDHVDFHSRGRPFTAATDNIAQAASAAGRSGVQFKDIHDIGPGFNGRLFSNKGYAPEQADAMNQQYVRELAGPSNIDVRLDPSLVRSRFARFDPAFKHLRNLSAGFGGLGLLGLAAGSQPAQGNGT